MRISIDGPDLESYNATRALQHWWDKGDRQQHPEFQLQLQRKWNTLITVSNFYFNVIDGQLLVYFLKQGKHIFWGGN